MFCTVAIGSVTCRCMLNYHLVCELYMQLRYTTFCNSIVPDTAHRAVVRNSAPGSKILSDLLNQNKLGILSCEKSRLLQKGLRFEKRGPSTHARVQYFASSASPPLSPALTA